MRTLRLLAAPAMAAAFMLTTPASAKLLINIDKSSQTMTVSQDGARLYTWPVSTGIARYDTPSGGYTPFRMEKDHFSKEWDDAPMPNSIFFTKRGHAIHGTNHTSIGRPASHGCVRLSVEHSRVLFDLVKAEGMANTKVVLDGEIPEGAPAVARLPRGTPQVAAQPRYQQGYGQQPGYYDERSQDDVAYSQQPYRGEQRGGYWLYPDGRRVYIERDPQMPPQQQGLFFPRRPGWGY